MTPGLAGRDCGGYHDLADRCYRADALANLFVAALVCRVQYV